MGLFMFLKLGIFIWNVDMPTCKVLELQSFNEYLRIAGKDALCI